MPFRLILEACHLSKASQSVNKQCCWVAFQHCGLSLVFLQGMLWGYLSTSDRQNERSSSSATAISISRLNSFHHLWTGNTLWVKNPRTRPETQSSSERWCIHPWLNIIMYGNEYLYCVPRDVALRDCPAGFVRWLRSCCVFLFREPVLHERQYRCNYWSHCMQIWVPVCLVKLKEICGLFQRNRLSLLSLLLVCFFFMISNVLCLISWQTIELLTT